MADSFVLTAQLNLRAPQNVDAIKRNIQSRLQGINAPINYSVSGVTVRQINGLNQSVGKLRTTSDSTFKAMSKQTGIASNELDGMALSLNKVGDNLAKALRRFGAFTIATTLLFGLIRAFQQNVKSALEFEKELNKISQVTGTSIKGLSSLRKEVDFLSTDLGVGSNQLLRAARTLSQAGLSAKETKVSLEALALSDLAPTFEDINKTTEGAIAIFRQFGKEASELKGILGSINAVSGKFAVESDDLITGVRIAGGAFEAAGGSLEEFFGLLTSVRATTRESASSIATGLRTIFTRIQRVSTQNFLEDFNIQLKLTREEANKLGKTEGDFVGPFEAVRRLSIALNDINSTDPRFAQITEQLGGFRQITKVIPLLKQYSLAQQSYNVALRGTNSLTKDAEKAQDTLLNKLTKLSEKFELFTRNITSSKAFEIVSNSFVGIADSILKVLDSVKELIPLLTIAGSLLAAKSIGPIAGGFLNNFSRSGSKKFATGGVVPGIGNKDNVNALLTPGEFVFRTEAVKRIGASNLEKMNKGELPGFNKGGLFGGKVGVGGAASSLVLGASIIPLISNFNDKLGETDNGLNDIISSLGGTILQFIIFSKLLGSFNKENKNATKLSQQKEKLEKERAELGVKTNSSGRMIAERTNPQVSQRLRDLDKSRKFLETRITNSNLVKDQSSAKIGEIFNRQLDKNPGFKETFLNKSQLKRDQDKITILEKRKSNARTTFDQQGSLLTSGTQNKIKMRMLELDRAAAFKDRQVNLSRDKVSQLRREKNPNNINSILEEQRFQRDAIKEKKALLNRRIRIENKNNQLLSEEGRVIVDRKQKDTALTSGRVDRRINQLKPNVLIQQERRNIAAENEKTRKAAVAKAKIEKKAAGIRAKTPQGILDAKNAEIAANQKAIEASEKASSRLNTFNASLALAGAALIAFGQYMNKQAEAEFSLAENSKFVNKDSLSNTKNKAALGSASTLAGTGVIGGAAAGLSFGPVGAAIGGVLGGITGGIYGFVTGLEQANLRVDAIVRNNKIDTLADIFTKVDAGKLSTSAASSGVNSGARFLRGELASVTDANAREDLIGRIESLKNPLQSFIDSAARSSSSLDDFNNKVGNDLVSLFTEINAIPITEFNEGIEKTIQLSARSFNVSQKLIKSENERLQRLAVQRVLASSLDDLSISTNKAINSLTLLSQFGSGDVANDSVNFAAPSLLDRFGNISDNQQFVNEIIKVGNLFGNSGRDLANTAIGTSEALNKLPNILSKIASGGGLEGIGNFESKLNTELNTLSTLPTFIKNQIIARVSSLIPEDGNDQDLVNKINTDLTNVINEVTKGLDDFSRPLKEAAISFQNQFNQFSSILEKRIELESRVVIAQNNSLANRELRETTFAGIQNRDPNTSLIRNIDLQRQGNILGNNSDAVNNPVEIFTRLVSAQEALLSSENKLNNATNLTAEEMFQLRKETVQQRIEVKDLTNGLSFLADASQRGAALQQQINAAQKDRNVKFGFAQELAFGGPKEQQKLINDVAMANQALASGLDGFSSDQLKAIQSLLSRVGDTKLFDRGNLSGNDALRQLTEGFINKFGGDAAGVVFPNAAEMQAQNELANVFNISDEALGKLETLALSSNTSFIQSLEVSFSKFLVDLQTNLTKSVNDELVSVREASINERKNAQRVNDQASVIESFTGTDLKTALGNFTNAKNIDSRISSIDSFNAQDNKVSLGSSIFTTDQKLETILTDISTKLSSTLGQQAGADFLTEFKTNQVGDVRRQFEKSRTGSLETVLNRTISNITKNANLEKESLSFQKNAIVANLGGKDLQANNIIFEKLISAADQLKEFKENNGDNFSVDRNSQKIDELTVKIQDLTNKIKGNPKGFARGGLVGGKGSRDSVPAMLMPGEFVLNQEAVNKIGISNLNRTNKGSVSVNRNGGSASSNSQNLGINQEIKINSQSLSELNRVIQIFGNNITRLESAFTAIPKEITMTGKHQLEVIINGAQVLQNIMPELSTMIQSEIKKSLNTMLKDKFPDKGQII